MRFKDKYTTEEKIKGDEKEKSKSIITNDAFAVGEMMEELKLMLWRIKNG